MEFSSTILLFSLSFVFFFLLNYHSSNRRSTSKLPPGPKGSLVIGNLLELGDKPYKSLSNLAKSYGPIMSLKLGQITIIVVSTAAMAKEVLQTYDQALCSRTVPDSMTVYDHHEVGFPWLPVADIWRTLRKVCNTHLFSQKVLDGNEIVRREKIRQLLADVRESAVKGEAIDIGRAAFTTTLNMMSNTIFSEDLADPNSEWAKEFKNLVWGIMEEAGKLNIGDYFPVLKKMDLQGRRRRSKIYFGKLLDIIGDMIDKRQQFPDKYAQTNDLLHNLLDLAKENNDSKIDVHLIKHLLLVLFPAGTDTTTSTVQWAMAELLRHPEILSKAQAELRQVIGRDKPVEETDFTRLPFLRAVVKETFRLHPPAPLLLPRKAKEDTEIGGFIIPKDAQVIVNAWEIGRDRKVWENPFSFNPERFLSSDVDFKGRNFELIPFGAGRRICPGLPLATRMLHFILASLIHSFDWKLDDGVTPENMNMDDKSSLTTDMAQPLKAVPILV